MIRKLLSPFSRSPQDLLQRRLAKNETNWMLISVASDDEPARWNHQL